MELIQAVTVGAGGSANITFTSIPQTYTDLVLVASIRNSTNQDWAFIKFNNSDLYYGAILLAKGDSSAFSTSPTSAQYVFAGMNPSYASSANSFASNEIYISNYASSTIKPFLSIGVGESNQTGSVAGISVNLRNDSAAISQIDLYWGNGVFVQYSTAYLYGVTSAAVGAQATGGVISQDATYWYHTFNSSGVFTPTSTVVADVLVAAGGGGGGYDRGGGGGGGGLVYASTQTLTGAKTVTIGAGGAGASSGVQGSNGGNTSFTGLTTATGGGGGGSYSSSYTDGLNGGCGGGGGSWNNNNTFLGGTGTQGFNGGTGAIVSSYAYWPGGGGGMGGVGANGATGRNSGGISGGLGVTYFNTNYCAGGGAGTESQNGFGRSGGASAGNGFAIGSYMNGLANQGGGGGGGGTGGNGGSGVVVVRYAK
jgi:hypothetical protein